jgi:hypothetical protein
MRGAIQMARGMRAAAALVALLALASCGGGGGGGSSSNDNPSPGVQAQACSVNNPYRGDATSTITTGSLTSEKTWVRDYVDRKYLWYTEVPAVNPNAAGFSNESDVYTSLSNYFDALLTPATTASGQFKDRFSFIYPTAAWDLLINSGAPVGYGIEWYIVPSTQTTPRSIRVAYVHPNTPGSANNILRGDTLVLADGVSAADNTQGGVNTLNNALFPSAAGTHTFRFSRGATTFDRTMAAGSVTLTPVVSQVLNVGGQNVGYLLFNDHVLTAEQPLINAFTQFVNANVTDLVLDLRYNSGGYLYIASEVAYMIAGAARINGRIFETTVFSNKRAGENSGTPFFNLACVPNPNTLQCTSNAALPSLNLPRVYVLTSSSTCSASEAIVNGLRGVDVDVRLIGRTTCGKPYGFFGQDNCGITYFPIEFQGINAKGFGDYADGFIPAGAGSAANNVPGCVANDDLERALGDPAEGQLAQALFHRANGGTACLAVARGGDRESPLAARTSSGSVVKATPLSNRYGRMPVR